MFLLFWSVKVTAQSHQLPSPQMSTSDDTNNPPPPGLIVPIDFGIPGVMAGGLIIGIYFLRNKRTISPKT